MDEALLKSRKQYGQGSITSTIMFLTVVAYFSFDSWDASVRWHPTKLWQIQPYIDIFSLDKLTCCTTKRKYMLLLNRISYALCFGVLNLIVNSITLLFCLRSVVDEDRSCQISAQVGSKLHIAGKPTSGRSVTSTRCGSRSHPWLLEAQTGQQVNISLLDFSGHGQRTQLDTRGLVSDDCGPAHVQYGYIVDKINKNNVSICSTTAQQRHQHVYQSAGNVIEIILTRQVTEDENALPNFLLSFQGNYNRV